MDEKPDTMSRSQRRQKVITDDDRILYLMDEISRGARRVYDARVARIGLNQTQWRIIGQLLRDPALTQAEIAKKLELESATIGQAVAGLCARGLMKRLRAETDRRISRYHRRQDPGHPLGTDRAAGERSGTPVRQARVFAGQPIGRPAGGGFR